MLAYINRELEIIAAPNQLCWPTKQKLWFQQIGHESPMGRVLQHGAPRPGGFLMLVIVFVALIALAHALG